MAEIAFETGAEGIGAGAMPGSIGTASGLCMVTPSSSGDYSLFWVVGKVGIEMSSSVTDRLLVGAVLSATFGALLFFVSALMPHQSNAYVPAISIAAICGTAFVGFFIAYLAKSKSKL